MELIDFLVKAKVNTYARGGESDERNLDDGGRELVYQENDWKYRDRYLGFDPFIGEEVVWRGGKVVWAMNYYGKILSNITDAKRIYDFLKKALSRVEKSAPFRGPRSFDNEDFSYRNSNGGSVEEFRGVEMILYQRKRVYELQYHGGTVMK